MTMSKGVPFYIVCFNRIDGLKFAIEFVEKSKLKLNLIVLDMGSTWPVFIEYRDSLGLEVIKFPKGMGPRDLWTSGVLSDLGSGPFFLSDGDLDYSGAAADAAWAMQEVSRKYPWFPKVGLALGIADLPDDSEGERVLAWESDNWRIRFKKIYI